MSDSATRVFLLRLPPNAPPVAVDNLPLLSTPEFADFIRGFLGQEISRVSLGKLVSGITDYAHRHGQPLVDVTIPPQNVANGDVHVVVVLGRYNLQRLIVSDTEAKAGRVVPGPNDGQIIVQDDPILGTRDFVRVVAPYFGHSITEESVNRMGDDINAYLKARGAILAHLALPRQDISGGVLRLGVSVGRYPLRRVVVAQTPREAESEPVPPGAGFVVAAHFPLFDTKDFRRLIAPYVGAPISLDSVRRLRQEVAAYVKNHDRLAVSVPEPQVDLARGELRFAVILARYGQIQFKGNRWFSSKLLAGTLGFKEGEEIRVSEMEAAVNRTNQNPFRHVDVLLNGLTPTAAASGDVPIAVQETETLPVRGSLSYDDSGNSTIGDNHYTAALSIGNLWGLDHQFSYQYTTTNNNRQYESQLANYRATLPWHDYVVLAGAYSDYNAVLADGHFDLKGDDVVLDGRYVHPIFGDTWSLELSLGFDYKELSSQLHFDGLAVPGQIAVNSIAQFTSGATYVQKDASGAWVAGVNLNGSPGGFNARNTTTRFQNNNDIDPTTGQPEGGPNAQARYIYGTATLQRLIQLPDDFQLLFRSQGQLSSSRLLSSERMTIGGVATVRGYNERIEAGDDGWQFTVEAHSPEWRFHLPFTPESYRPVQNRFLVFFDDADIMYDHPTPNDAFVPAHRLESVGFGIRSNWASNFSLSADYGFQQLSTGAGFLAQPRQARGDIQATISY